MMRFGKMTWITLGVLAAGAIVGAELDAATVALAVPKIDGAAGKMVVVPVQARSAEEVGCMQLVLAYDASILEVKNVEGGSALPTGALVDHNKDDAGWLRTGFVCSPSGKGVKGEGPVLQVHFLVKGQTGQKSPLRLEKVRAWESADPEMLVQTEPGELTVVFLTMQLWIYLAIGAGALLLLLLMVLVVRRRRQPIAAAGYAPGPYAQPYPGAAPAPAGALPRFAPDEPTFQHVCNKCAGVIRLPRSMVGQAFQCAACGAQQVGGQS